MPNLPNEQLFQWLKSEDVQQRDQATQLLWTRWFEQKGLIGLQRLKQSQVHLQQREFEQALDCLNELIEEMPDFVEAWNRRAVFYFMQRQYQQAIRDCEQVVQMNPQHFGAWSGLALCHCKLAEYQPAIMAVRQALEIQPHSVENQRLLLECTAKLPS